MQQWTLNCTRMVVSSMMHEPCGSINSDSPSMEHGHCSKKYPRPFPKETQLGADSYPLYRRVSPEDGGQVATITVIVRGNRITHEIDYRWIVPYKKYSLRSLYCRSVYVYQLYQAQGL